jgi:hypothetical protein
LVEPGPKPKPRGPIKNEEEREMLEFLMDL